MYTYKLQGRSSAAIVFTLSKVRYICMYPPSRDKNGDYEKCIQYVARNRTWGGDPSDLSSWVDRNRTETCPNLEFDSSIFESTIVTDVSPSPSNSIPKFQFQQRSSDFIHFHYTSALVTWHLFNYSRGKWKKNHGLVQIQSPNPNSHSQCPFNVERASICISSHFRQIFTFQFHLFPIL